MREEFEDLTLFRFEAGLARSYPQKPGCLTPTKSAARRMFVKNQVCA